MKDDEGITKEHACLTHGHGQQYGDSRREGSGWGLVELGKGRKSGNNCNSINNLKNNF